MQSPRFPSRVNRERWEHLCSRTSRFPCRTPMFAGSRLTTLISQKPRDPRLHVQHFVVPSFLLLKLHMPYHESDHVLNVAYNILCNGGCLEDIELRRADMAYFNSLGAVRIPDPTTERDFCRRFTESAIRTLQNVFHEIRLKVWHRQLESFLKKPSSTWRAHSWRRVLKRWNGLISPTTGRGVITHCSYHWPIRVRFYP